MAPTASGRWQAPLDAAVPIRLDDVRLPYGPCPAALDAIAAPSDATEEELATALRRRLGSMYRIPSDAIRLLPAIDEGISRALTTRSGPLIGFPPSASASLIERRWPARDRLLITRGAGDRSILDPDVAADLPGDGVAVIDSPANPLGTLLKPADAVRLARACGLLLVDERYVEFSGQSLQALCLEFNNIVVFRSFDVWAGLHETPCAWAVASPAAREALGGDSAGPDRAALVAAMATLDSVRSVNATLRLVREERSRLYRLLRKLSILEPLPSWGPFLTARVTIGSRDVVVAALRERGVLVHAPGEQGLERYVRFGIGTRSAMDHLRIALLDLIPEVVG